MLVLVILSFMIPVWTFPMSNTGRGVQVDYLSTRSDIEEPFGLKKKIKEVQGGDALQVLDQLILDDAGGLSAANMPEISPTIEDTLAGPVNSAKVDLEEINPVSREIEHLSGVSEAELLQVRQRLQKLDFYFEFLRVLSEDCRQRMLCEVMREPVRFYPLSSVLEDAISFTGSYQYLTSQLVSTTEGARLLSYLEASFRGQDRTRSCAVFQYRCPSKTEEMINYDALCLWREMVRWLTIHVIAKAH